MEKVEEWHKETWGQKAASALKHHGFDAFYLASKEEAVSKALEFVEPGKTVAFGGSVTLTRDLKLPEKVREKGGVLLEATYGDPETFAESLRKQLLSDVFFSSANAVTLDGAILNLDGVGNRVASMIFGPKKVVLIVGINKVCRDEAAAWERIRHVAAPMNMVRLDLEAPCVRTGYCVDCESPARGCRVYVVQRRKPRLTDTTVMIVGENLGC